MKLFHIEKHESGLGAYIKDIIYAANDGIITTFAVVAGVAGASLSITTILILGFANLLADGFSMAVSNYMGSRSESARAKKEKKREEREILEKPEEERHEVMDVLCARGYSMEDAEAMTAYIMKNDKFWVDFMMRYELGIDSGGTSDKRAALYTFVAFVTAGSLPLLPFILLYGTMDNLFFISALATAIAFFVVGALRVRVTKKNWFISGLEMLVVGGTAAAIAYGIGYGISAIIN